MAQADAAKQLETPADPLADDPFFRLSNDATWNACIGKQGSEENYLDGYIEAASVLVKTVIDNNMFEKRDTVVLAILYNARHAVELTLKFAVDRLVEVGVLSRPVPRNHDISAYQQLLSGADLGDEELRKHVRALEPFVQSLARIDEDGQELRYHVNRDEIQSLSTYSLANLEVIRDSLDALSEIISDLKYRILDFIDERGTVARTTRLSRQDLICIAKLMPPFGRWKEKVFDEKKQIILSRYSLSSNEFSKAIDVIKNNREMKALLGKETSLLYLPDEMLLWVVRQWRKLHPIREGGASNIVAVNKATIQAIIENSENEVVSALRIYLTNEQLAELQAIYYFGRDKLFPERYEEYVESVRQQHKPNRGPAEQISRLIHKTNFLIALKQGLPRLGRPSLSAQLSGL